MSDIRDRYVYTVLCRVLGETKATLTVFSEGRSGQRIESSASVSLFRCGVANANAILLDILCF